MAKSAAKIRRNQARAAARGESYTPPPPKPTTSLEVSQHDENDDNDEHAMRKSAAAQKLERTLADIDNNVDGLNSKDRRTAKRKAEAIAAEEAGCPADQLLQWHSIQRRKKKRSSTNDDNQTNKLSPEDEAKLTSAKKLREALAQLDGLNAKERRSAKRKAEAIATEETGCQPTELLQWSEAMLAQTKNNNKNNNSSDGEAKNNKTNPYILFVGQLAYTTTTDQLFQHFQQTLGPEVIHKDSIQIRLLTDATTKKSKGMAFIELSTPETMYECLKMHLTHLDGRRINVERSSGGGHAAKKSKITSFREEQSSFISQTMDKIIEEHVKNGEIEEGELDEGVIALCKRHSATVVEQALKEYVEEKRVRKERKEKWGEKEEEEFRNPSAFLTHVIGRVAEEGGAGGQVLANDTKGGSGSGHNRSRGSSGNREKTRGDGREDSVLEKSGVDMSISYKKSGNDNSKIASIFPSMQRGRGRGRGYMH
ncbi:hypothetical protein HJC23_007766 [Cyclotella cryptica]|uniref:RRM domain-containing protein n=1 Tax=Cyclotella cryptica TaxID=29204 RepID=A0ABD3QZQ9_9STRA|eukprot:CCRYP_000038-RA/>CCRYP_000038-RA protein AED:0.00 eAED:0.00 QI:0/-1/0/1/-1/1/1/0/480